jgi:SanA protein
MNLWVARYGRRHGYQSVAEVPARPVAIVLGARVHPDGSPSTALADRLEGALELYRAGRVDAILVSGDARAREYDEPKAMRRWLLDRGVSAERIRADPAGYRTLHTMQRAAKVFGIDGAVICTQAFHLARALFLARRAGIDAVGLCVDRRYRTRTSNHLREFGARTVAFVESYVLRSG